MLSIYHPFVAFLFAIILFPASSHGQERILFGFEDAQAASAWQIVNDGVMGGLSKGQARINASKNLEFFGTLSLENNGGFASVRGRKAGLNLNSGENLVLRVLGDGREYNLNLYAQRNLSGYSYRQSFKTVQGKWVEVKLPVDDFVATWRGRTFQNQRLNPASVQGIGILLGDKQPGPFKIEVDWIKAGPE